MIVTYELNLRSQLRLAYYKNSKLTTVKSFITLATIIMIVKYDCKTFILQATGVFIMKLS